MKFALRVIPEFLAANLAALVLTFFFALVIFDPAKATFLHDVRKIWPALEGVALTVWLMFATGKLMDNREGWIRAIEQRERDRAAIAQRQEAEIDALLQREKVL